MSEYELWLSGVCEEIQNSAAEGMCQSEDEELLSQSGWEDRVECWAVVNKQHSNICVLVLQMCESRVDGGIYCIISLPFRMICKL